MPPLLSLQNITAGYGGKAVINDICFDVCASEFCALLGLNGSGKTTLLKTICGLLPAISGKIIVSGEDCTELGEHKRSRHMSYILQRHSKLIGVTVMDAVLMGLNPNLGLFNYPTATDKARAEETLEKFGIAHLAGKDFSKLSEGQKQIVILTRTLIQDTPVMLMDEPDSALDFSNRHKTLKRIRKLIHSEKKAGLVTLHDPNLALEYCDRLILLDDGINTSEIHLESATAQEIETCLKTIYSNISLIQHDGKHIVISNSAD